MGMDWTSAGPLEALRTIDKMLAARRRRWIHVRNLPGDIECGTLESVFSFYGCIEDCRIMPGSSKRGQAAALIKYSRPSEAGDAVAAMAQGYEISPGEGDLIVTLAVAAK
eukprot:TRINITY_DN87556_c0_g1_i1.p1 TRINITY_DN87556_c0_g1~~TRINITY_DN87556_c0_g1_i1.p1  ORF type:complete len:110 (-),score=28.33 TRINITY_DN87556_c0_g1_i1:102-431(-)